MKVHCAMPITPTRRVSPDSAWPLRRADGQTYAQVQPHYKQKEIER
jgi:hypothetical protein